MNGMSDRQHDKRFRRTRAWIVQAFNELLFQRAYAGLPTALIVKRAGVGRSTFYEHFKNKDEVLLQSVAGILGTLADAVADMGNSWAIRGVVDHILNQRAMAQPLLTGANGEAITTELARLIEDRLSRGGYDAEPPVLIVPTRLVARQIAEAQMALLCGWLAEDDASRCSSSALTAAICRSSRGLAQSLVCE